MEESENTGVIYCITNLKNDKKYVGQAVSYKYDRGKVKRHGMHGRFEDHKKLALNDSDDCPKLYAAMRKDGVENFVASLLEIVELENLFEKEIYFIIKNDTIKNGYNIVLPNNETIKSKKDITVMRLSRIEKISKTLTEKYQNDSSFADKVYEAQSVNKKLDHNGNPLPKHIYVHKARGENGYRVSIGKVIDDKRERNEKSFTDPEKTMDEKLELAKKTLEEFKSSLDKVAEKRKNNVKHMLSNRLDYDNITPLPKGVHRYSKSGSPGYFATIYNKGKVKTKRITDSELTLAEKLDKIKEWLKENSK